MKVLVFGKKRQAQDGRTFTAYVTKMTRKDGSELTAGVKFREECGAPKLEETPCYIEFDKSNGNLTTKTIEVTTQDGEIKDVVQNTLWVKAWKMSNEKFIDKSLDDFE